MTSDSGDTPAQGSGDASTDPEDDPFLNELGDDIRDVLGADADITFRDYSDHIDVRILPNDVKRVLEEKYDGVTVTPYNGFRMTLQKRADADQQDGAADP